MHKRNGRDEMTFLSDKIGTHNKSQTNKQEIIDF